MIARLRRASLLDEGAAAVEFAIVVPLLLLLLFGFMNFAIIFAQQLSLNNAVRQGARAAVAEGNTGQVSCADVVSGVRDASYAIAMDPTKINVTVQTQSAAGVLNAAQPCGNTPNPSLPNVVCQNSFQTTGSDSIVVTATYQSKFLLPFPPVPGSPGILNPPVMSAKAVYRCEFS